MDDRKDIKIESLKDLLYKAVLVKNDKTPSNSFWDELYDKDPDAFLKGALAMCSYSKHNVGYRTKDGTKLYDVKGLRCLCYGLPMLYTVAKKDPEKLYGNLSLIGVLFGGWNTVFKLWEYCIIRAKFNMDRLVISQNKVARTILPACYDTITGPDFCKALPIIRNLSKMKTKHNKAWNLVGKYMRYSLIPGDKFKMRRMRMYQDIRKIYSHRITPYKKMDNTYFAELSPDELYDELINQPAFELLWDGTPKNNFNYLTSKNYVHRTDPKHRVCKTKNKRTVRPYCPGNQGDYTEKQGTMRSSGNIYPVRRGFNDFNNYKKRQTDRTVQADGNNGRTVQGNGGERPADL